MRGELYRQEHRWCSIAGASCEPGIPRHFLPKDLRFRCRAMTRVYSIELYFPQYNFPISFVALEADASRRYIL